MDTVECLDFKDQKDLNEFYCTHTITPITITECTRGLTIELASGGYMSTTEHYIKMWFINQPPKLWG